MSQPSGISLHTVAVFCEHTAEMLEGVSDSAELIKRHRDSLEALARAKKIVVGKCVVIIKITAFIPDFS